MPLIDNSPGQDYNYYPQQEMYQQPSMVRVDRRDDGFLKWFLENKEAIENLKYVWKGYEMDDKGDWVKTPHSDEHRIMNDRGIHWSTGIMITYLNKIFQATNWNEDHMNFEMRKAYRSVWLGLVAYYKEFEISKVSTQMVANGILAQIHAMMLSARAEGIRNFLTRTQSVSEIRNIQPQQQGGGFFSGFSGIFRKNNSGGGM